MDLLAIVQSLHYEAKFSGPAPAAVTGQTGRAADIVRWSIEAYNDIQREKDGRWKWLRRDFELDTVAGTSSYAFSAANDVVNAAPIARFRAWHLHQNELPYIFLVSDGKVSEQRLSIADWTSFRDRYVRGVHETSYPGCLSVDLANRLYLGPTPNDIYRVSGSYWASNQELEANDDIPEMPADYHMMIVYRALAKYGYNSVGHEILARASADGAPLYEALRLNQGYDRFSITVGDALA